MSVLVRNRAKEHYDDILGKWAIWGNGIREYYEISYFGSNWANREERNEGNAIIWKAALVELIIGTYVYIYLVMSARNFIPNGIVLINALI